MLERDIFFLLDKTVETMFPELTEDFMKETKNINEIRKENVIYHLKDNEWLVNYLSSLSPNYSKTAIENYILKSKNFKNALNTFEQKYSMYRLDQIIKKMLPEITFDLLFKKRKRQDLTKENIVLNLENKEWLINYYHSIFSNITRDKIEQYLNTSSGFNKIIHDYQMSIARWIINYMNVNAKGFLVTENHLHFTVIESDYAFRRSLSDSLKYIGFSYDRREEAIETFSKFWRSPRMRAFFYHAYAGNIALVARETYKKHDLDFRDKWLRLKEYDYYQKHKESVDKYSEPTPAMLMDKKEAEELKNLIIELSEARHAEMEYFKENMTTEEAALKVLKRI